MHVSELVVILLVALLVIKPERLPAIAFNLGRWMKWLRHKINQIQYDLNNDK